jgi:hypothetical protein
LTPKGEEKACKVRLSQVFKKPGQTIMDFMNETKLLTEKDLEDFRGWFRAAGYPCTGLEIKSS